MVGYKYMMRKVIILLVVLVGMSSVASANDYGKAVIGHVITNHDKIDHSKLMEAELEKLAHQMSIQVIGIMQQHLPQILDGAMTDLRLKYDSKYKCALLKDTKIADKECE